MGAQPESIHGAAVGAAGSRRSGRRAVGNSRYFSDGERVKPFVNLRMSIAEGKPASSIMEGSWRVRISPRLVLGRRCLGAIIEVGVVDAVRMLIKKDKNRGRLGNAGQLHVLGPCVVELGYPLIGVIGPAARTATAATGAIRK